jgi:hypothetical protein
LEDSSSKRRKTSTALWPYPLEAVGLIPFLTPRKTVRLATWNVRTLYEAGRTAQVTKEMKHYNICLQGLSGTRWLQSGQLRLTSGEMLLYSGHIEEGAPHTEGIDLMLSLDGNRSSPG